MSTAFAARPAGWRRHLLWIDGGGAAVVGVLVLVLALSGWLSDLHALPRGVLVFTGAANLGYASYSLTLARRARRPLALIRLLVAANLAWAVVCAALLVRYGATASPFGWLHLGGEGLYVGGLALLEWRWRDVLRTR